MATWHINEIKRMLEDSEMMISSKLDGNDYDVSETWVICTKEGKQYFLDFEGLDDEDVLPLEKSYGLKIRGDSSPGLYIPKRKPRDSRPRSEKTWSKDLHKFIEKLV
jgi:hypothetical protein